MLSVCRQCHNAIHRFFTNEELAESYFTLDLLLDAPKFFKYAKWASRQKSRYSNVVKIIIYYMYLVCFLLQLYKVPPSKHLKVVVGAIPHCHRKHKQKRVAVGRSRIKQKFYRPDRQHGINKLGRPKDDFSSSTFPSRKTRPRERRRSCGTRLQRRASSDFFCRG